MVDKLRELWLTARWLNKQRIPDYALKSVKTSSTLGLGVHGLETLWRSKMLCPSAKKSLIRSLNHSLLFQWRAHVLPIVVSFASIVNSFNYQAMSTRLIFFVCVVVKSNSQLCHEYSSYFRNGWRLNNNSLRAIHLGAACPLSIEER